MVHCTFLRHLVPTNNLSATSHSDAQYTESLWPIRHYVMRPSNYFQSLRWFWCCISTLSNEHDYVVMHCIAPLAAMLKIHKENTSFSNKITTKLCPTLRPPHTRSISLSIYATLYKLLIVYERYWCKNPL